MTRWYTADTHLGHTNILKYCNRPWDNVTRMNEAIIDNINEICNEDDELWILGDIALGQLRDSLDYIQFIKPEVHAIIGNHDRCFIRANATEAKIAKAERSRQPYLNAGIVSLQTETRHLLGDHEVVLSHFPYSEDHTETDRFTHARPKNEGKWLLCGHVHNLWKQREKQINVGVDVRNFYPIHEDEITHIISKGPQDID